MLNKKTIFKIQIIVNGLSALYVFLKCYNCVLQEDERIRFQNIASQGARPSCVSHEMNMRNLENDKRIGDSILGQVSLHIVTFVCGHVTQQLGC